MIYEYECVICGKVFELIRGLEDISVVKHCDKPARKLVSRFFAYRDLRFNFTSVDKNNREVEIRTKGRWDRFLKQNNLTEFIPGERVKKKDDTKEISKKLAKQCVREIYDKRAIDWVQGRENFNGPDKIKQKI